MIASLSLFSFSALAESKVVATCGKYKLVQESRVIPVVTGFDTQFEDYYLISNLIGKVKLEFLFHEFGAVLKPIRQNIGEKYTVGITSKGTQLYVTNVDEDDELVSGPTPIAFPCELP